MNVRRIIGLLVLVIGLGLFAKGLSVLLKPAMYEATVKIEIQPDTISDVASFCAPVAMPYDPYFMETELRAIESDMVLSNVVQALDLDEEWGKRRGNGKTLETGEVIKLVRQRMALDAERNTKMIEISVWDEDPKESARIANAIADSYSKYRLEQHREQWQSGMKKLEKDYQEQAVEIENMQSNLEVLRKQYNIKDTDPSATVPTNTITIQQMQHYSELQIEAQQDYMKLENQLKELQSVQATNPAALRDILPTVETDSILSDLLGTLHENEEKYTVETNSMVATNPDAMATRAVIGEVNKEIDERVKGIMLGLASNVKSQKAALDALNKQVADIEDQAQEEAGKGQPYWAAKLALMDKRELHKMFAAKIESMKADSATAGQPLVTVIDRAAAPQAPIGPGRGWGAVMTACGLGVICFGFCLVRFKPKSADDIP